MRITEAEEIVEELERKLDKWEREGRDVEGLINDVEWMLEIYENVKENAEQAAEVWCAYVWALARRKGLEDDEAKMICEWRTWALLNAVEELDYASEYRAVKGLSRILKGWLLDHVWIDGEFTETVPRHIRDEAWTEVLEESERRISYPPEVYNALVSRLASYWARYRERYLAAGPAERYEIAREIAPRLIREMERHLCQPPRGMGPYTPRSLMFNVQALEIAVGETGETDLEDFLANIRRRLDVESRRIRREEWCKR